MSKSLPESVLLISTYSELAEYARAFAADYLNLLFVFGDPGLGKSRCIRNAVGKQACWIDGTATAFGVYVEAFHHRDQPIILDDVDGLYKDRNGVRLLKSLCQTDPVKTVSWHTNAVGLSRQSIPRKFTTSSRAVIIANQWKSLNADVVALEDRGHVIAFAPSSLEVHRQAATWFWDQQVFDFVAEHLHLIERPSLRTYVLAFELKSAGLDWEGGILSRFLSGTALQVAKLKSDPSFDSEKARVIAFVKSGAGCRATYFNHAKRLQPLESVPNITLVNKEPPTDRQHRQDILDLLRQRFGKLGNG